MKFLILLALTTLTLASCSSSAPAYKADRVPANSFDSRLYQPSNFGTGGHVPSPPAPAKTYGKGEFMHFCKVGPEGSSEYEGVSVVVNADNLAKAKEIATGVAEGYDNYVVLLCRRGNQ